MKTIGILGGMSWESTTVYYQKLNQIVQERLGGVASASLIIRSFDFREIEELQHSEDWDALTTMLTEAAAHLRTAGADFLLIATNTMHLMADEVEAGSGLPVLHIADAAAEWIVNAGYRTVALLGTKFTMEKAFYADRIAQKSGAEVLTPEAAERDLVHRTIYGELCAGTISDASREQVVAIINRLAAAGAECAILGCTELPLLVHNGDADIPVLDTMAVHVAAAIERAQLS